MTILRMLRGREVQGEEGQEKDEEEEQEEQEEQEEETFFILGFLF